MGIYRLQVCKYTLGDRWRLQAWIIIVTAMFSRERSERSWGLDIQTEVYRTQKKGLETVVVGAILR